MKPKAVSPFKQTKKKQETAKSVPKSSRSQGQSPKSANRCAGTSGQHKVGSFLARHALKACPEIKEQILRNIDKKPKPGNILFNLDN